MTDHDVENLGDLPAGGTALVYLVPPFGRTRTSPTEEGKPTIIKEGTRVGHGSEVGAGSTIERNVHIEDDVRIDQRVTLERQVVLAGGKDVLDDVEAAGPEGDGAGARGVEPRAAVLPPQPHEPEHGLVHLLRVRLPTSVQLPPDSVFSFRRIRCSASAGFGVQLPPDSVFSFRRIRCSASAGFGVQLPPDSVFSFRRIRCSAPFRRSTRKRYVSSNAELT